MKHHIFEFSLFSKIFCFVSKGSFNIPESRCLLICRVQYLYTIEHAVENIAYHTVKPLIKNTSKEFIKCRILQFLIMECCRYLVF